MIDGFDGLSSTAGAASLDEHIGNLLDGFSGASGGESPEPASTEEGAQPSPDASAAPDSTPPAVGTDAAAPSTPEPTGAQPVVAAADAAAAPSTDDDPFKGATPFTYKVNGQERTADYTKVLRTPDGEIAGVVIEKPDIPAFEAHLSERSALYEQSRVHRQQIDELTRLTEWRQTDGEGKESVLTGLKGIEAQRVALGRSMAALTTLAQVFKQSPVQFLAEDAEGNLVWDATRVDHLVTRAKLAEMEAEQNAKQHMTQFSDTIRQTAQQQVEDAEMPQKLWAAIETGWLANFPDLTPQDRQFLQGQMPRYVRAPTPEEARQGYRSMMRDEFYEVIKDRAELRKANTASIKATADTTAKATKENAARLAAATIGKPKATTPTQPKPKPVSQEASRKQDGEDAYDAWERAASRLVRARNG